MPCMPFRSHLVENAFLGRFRMVQSAWVGSSELGPSTLGGAGGAINARSYKTGLSGRLPHELEANRYNERILNTRGR